MNGLIGDHRGPQFALSVLYSDGGTNQVNEYQDVAGQLKACVIFSFSNEKNVSTQPNT
jgi:hypothetical protein